MMILDTAAQKYAEKIAELRQLHQMLTDNKYTIQQNKKLRDTETKLRRDLVWRLSIEQGLSQTQIGELLGYSQPTISRDYTSVIREAQGMLVDAASDEVALQVNQLKFMISELREAWEISKGTEKIVTSTKRKDSEDEDVIVTTTRVRLREGNVRYLSEIRDCMDNLREILGINAPDKMDVTSGGQPMDSITIIVKD